MIPKPWLLGGQVYRFAPIVIFPLFVSCAGLKPLPVSVVELPSTFEQIRVSLVETGPNELDVKQSAERIQDMSLISKYHDALKSSRSDIEKIVNAQRLRYRQEFIEYYRKDIDEVIAELETELIEGRLTEGQYNSKKLEITKLWQEWIESDPFIVSMLEQLRFSDHEERNLYRSMYHGYLSVTGYLSGEMSCTGVPGRFIFYCGNLTVLYDPDTLETKGVVVGFYKYHRGE